MRSAIAFALLIVLWSGSPASTQSHEALAFTNATVIDTAGGPARPGSTVLVAGDRIAAVGPTRQVPLPEGANVVDATGKYVIPGLWDMHVHALSKDRLDSYFALFLANGVTGVRDMGSPMSLPEIAQLRRQIDVGKVLAPRIGAATGQILEGAQAKGWGEWAVFKVIRSPEEGKRAVTDLKRAEANFIKVYNLLPRAIYFAIAEEAKKQGIPFAGHVPFAVSSAEAADAGQQSIEHLLEGILLLDCAADGAKLRAELLAAGVPSDLSRVPDFYSRILTKAMESYDNATAAALFKTFVQKGVWQVPTLTYGRTHPLRKEDPVPDKAWMKYVPESVRRDWENYRAHRRGPGELAFAELLWKRRLELVRSMHRAGVLVLAGSDAGWGNEYTFPGFSLHDELQLLVDAGLSPLSALQAATLNPARYLGATDTMGTVEPRKMADLVLLEANPLEDIRNTRRIAAVVVRGRLLDRSALARLLRQAQDLVTAQKPSSN